MRKTVIDYLNFCLAGIVIVLVFLYGITLLKKKEFDKVSWSAKIVSSEPNSKEEKANMLKIVDAVFMNTFNHSKNTLHFDSPKLIVSKGSDSAYFWSQDDLLPDSLSIKYFSVNEKNFYHLNTKLPLEKMQNSLESKNKRTDLKLEIQPKGKISVMIESPDNKGVGLKLVESFQAKEIPGALKMLVYRTYSGKEFNEFPSLKDVSDYSDVLTQKYLWKVKIETENTEKISEILAYAFDGKSMSADNEAFEDEKLRNIPKKITMDWGNTQRYGSNYFFDSQEILDAFKALDQIKTSQPVVITFKLFKNAYPKAEISKEGKTIPLKDVYPDIPTKYAY